MVDPTTVTDTEGAADAAPSAPTGAGGSGLELRNLTKVFPGGTVAVEDVNLTIEHGEYVVLLGPSGCGKTTTLRMIGGHEDPTSGDVLLDGESILGLTPDKRPTTTVFQHFALFPHKSVLENVEFGLKMHGMAKEQRREKAREALEMVGLSQLWRPQAAGALGRPAAAGRARPRARHEPEGAPARRAARRPRPAPAAPDAGRAAQPPAAARPDVHPRDAQPGGVALDGRPDRRHARGEDPAGRRPAHHLHAAQEGGRRGVHGRQQHRPGNGHLAGGRAGSSSTPAT